MKLGRVRSVDDERLFRLSNYVAFEALKFQESKLPEFPERELLHTDKAHPFPMLANDHLPCCASAAAGHMVHCWTEENGNLVLLTEDDIVQAHSALTGGNLLSGVSMLDALRYWRKTGVGKHSIYAFVAAAKGSRSELQCILHLFGGAYLGLDLPDFAYPTPLPADLSAIPQIPWEVPANLPSEACQPNPDKGHCVAAIGYDQDVVYLVTWGTLKTMSWEFYERYVSEAYAVLSLDWASANKAAPTGFDVNALQRDLESVTAKTP